MTFLRREALPYAGFYASFFLATGVFLPFWPLWLGGRGLSAEEIGLVLGLSSALRIVGMPLVGRIADRSERSHRVMLQAALVSAGLFALFPLFDSFWPIFFLHLVWVIPYSALTPLGESETMRAVRRHGIDYGRVRLWGSLTFIAGSVVAGPAIERAGSEAVWVLVLGALVLSILVIAALPGVERPAETESPNPLHRRGVLALLGDRTFLLFLIAGSLLQASHGAYYGFSAIHWKAEGLSETLVGLLWAEGVIAEVVLFLYGLHLTRHLGPARLLILAGVAGLIRWPLMALSADPLLLAGGQLLHAFTFGAAHLALVTYIAERAPPRLAATAQSLYAAVSGGLGMSASLWMAGRIYAAEPSWAFLFMAVISGAGLAAALILRMANLRAAAEG